MIIIEDGYTHKREIFKTIYQASKYFYESGVTKNKNSITGIKNALKQGTTVYKHYFVYEIPDSKEKN